MIVLRFIPVHHNSSSELINCYNVFIGGYLMCENFTTAKFERRPTIEYVVTSKTDFLCYRVVHWWLYLYWHPDNPSRETTNLAIELLFTDPPEKVLDLLLLTC